MTNTNDSGSGSLRQAILDANGNPGLDTIQFRINSGNQTIRPLSELPEVTDPVIIDGTTQPGGIITLNGALAGPGSSGLRITAGESTIKGLMAINGFSGSGIWLGGNGGNIIRDTFIGIDASGTVAVPNGLGVTVASDSNTVGRSNVISGNSEAGVSLLGNFNRVEGNLIGTDFNGTTALGNGLGVEVTGDNNTIGDNNFISGNRATGILLIGNQNTVHSDNVGIDVSGFVGIGNGTGLEIQGKNNTVGPYNTFSGNKEWGIIVNGPGNLVSNSLVGTDVNAEFAIPNGGGILINADSNIVGPEIVASGNLGFGILIAGGQYNLIQGTCTGDSGSGLFAIPNADGMGIMSSNNSVVGNVISGNNNAGVLIGAAGSANNIEGNFIGLEVNSGPLGNGVGLDIQGADNIVQNGNLIAGNKGDGIAISGTGNLVRRNAIGLDVTDTMAVPNGTGITITGSNNTIGGEGGGVDSNIISGNNGPGVAITGEGNLVRGNYIGVDGSTTNPLGNQDGIVITGNGNRTEGNLVSSNAGDGILIQSGQGNLVQGNLIGTDGTQTLSLGNGRHGINIDFASNNQIGGDNDKASNIIAFNGRDGILVRGGTGNALRRNIVFAHAAGLGIELSQGGNNNQAAPEVTAAFPAGSRTDVEGTLNSTPNTTFILEFFQNQVCNPSGFGEAENFVDTLTLTTDENGVAVISALLSQFISPGRFLTATATDPNDNTSAYSQCIEVSGGDTPSRPSLVTARQGRGINSSWSFPVRKTSGLPDTLSGPVENNVAFSHKVWNWIFTEFRNKPKRDLLGAAPEMAGPCRSTSLGISDLDVPIEVTEPANSYASSNP